MSMKNIVNGRAEQERILEAQDLEHEHKERQSLSDYIKETFNRVAWKFWKRTGELPAKATT